MTENNKKAQARNYELVSPAGQIHYFRTYELKNFCKENELNWSCLMARKKARTTLRGWRLTEVIKPVKHKKLTSDI